MRSSHVVYAEAGTRAPRVDRIFGNDTMTIVEVSV
jgi:hypothetical protein